MKKKIFGLCAIFCVLFVGVILFISDKSSTAQEASSQTSPVQEESIGGTGETTDSIDDYTTVMMDAE